MYLKTYIDDKFLDHNCEFGYPRSIIFKKNKLVDMCTNLVVTRSGKGLSFEKKNKKLKGDQEFLLHRNYIEGTVSFRLKSDTNYFIKKQKNKIVMDYYKNEENFKYKISFLLIKENKYYTTWLCPYPINCSGGIRTLLRMAYYNSMDKNQIVHIWIRINGNEEWNRKKIVDTIINEYSIKNIPIYLYNDFNRIPKIYHTIFCTNPVTTYDAYNMSLANFPPFIIPYHENYINNAGKILFIQDTEWLKDFIGDSDKELYNIVYDSYKLDMSYITMGNYLKNILVDKFKKDPKRIKVIDFCIDKEIYYKPTNNERIKNSICLLYQPEKNRRDPKFTKKLNDYLKEKGIHTFMFGSSDTNILTTEECGDIYRKYEYGFIVQNSNPSRIPYEMYECGLKVITCKTEQVEHESIFDDLKFCHVVNNNVDEIYNLIINNLFHNDNNCKIKNFDIEMSEFIKYSRKITSFDLFDTLIARHEEYKSNKNIRNTYKNIYEMQNIIPPEHIFYHADKNSIYPIRQNVDLFNSLNNKIIITDMYYNIDKIKTIVKENGISDSLIFLSSDKKCTKYDKLYELVLETLDILPEQLYHIGDDYNADVLNSSRFNISSSKIDTEFSDYEKNISYKRMNYCVDDICDELVNDMVIFNSDSSNERNDELSYYLKRIRLQNYDNDNFINEYIKSNITIITPLLISYVEWCIQKSLELGIYRLLFMARDGYILYEIAKMFKNKYSELEIEYVYNSRAMVNPMGLTEEEFTYENIKSGTANWIINKQNGEITLGEVYERLWQTDFDTDKEITDIDEIIEYLIINKNNIIKNIKESNKYKNNKKYMDNYFEEPCIVIDSGWYCNMIHSIRKIYPDNKLIIGLFISLYKINLYNETDLNISWLNANSCKNIPIQAIFELILPINDGVTLFIDENGNPKKKEYIYDLYKDVKIKTILKTANILVNKFQGFFKLKKILINNIIRYIYDDDGLYILGNFNYSSNPLDENPIRAKNLLI